MIFTAFVNFSRLTAIRAAATSLLAVVDSVGPNGGVVEVPTALNPNKLSVFRTVSATGVQIYYCTRGSAGALGWTLAGPDAQLLDSQGQLVGRHYAGPTWEGLDGGKVVAGLKASVPAPIDNAIPWLLLDVKSREGSGGFTQSRAIVRMGTTGGTAPAASCDEASAGREVRVPYTATYFFLK
jgi:hypothetical protein